MQLLSVSHFYETHGGGIERVAAQLCRAFTQMGVKAGWAASDVDLPPEPPIEAVSLPCANPIERLVGLPMPIPGRTALNSLGRAVRGSDAIIIHDALYLTSIAAMVLAKVRRKPAILIQHVAAIPFANPAMRALMSLANLLVTQPMMRAADRLVFISDTVRRDLLGDHSSLPFMLLHNGVDPAVFHVRPASERMAIRRAHALPESAEVALFVGRFVEKKGLNILRALAAQQPDLHIAIVGSGPIRPESWSLPNIHILGPKDQTTIARLYGAADLLLLPSAGEGYPLVVQEAMACGLPVVCGQDSAAADPAAGRWLHGVSIDLADPEGSARRCADAIAAIALKPTDRAAMAQYTAHSYSWPAMAEAILRAARSLVEQRQPASLRP